jgi:hypothetical protein
MSITGKRTDRKHMSIQDMLASAARHQDFSILFAVRQGEQARIPDAARGMLACCLPSRMSHSRAANIGLSPIES